ncbi:hypothetical protein [Yinghuangia sp. YIM S09857]|uniref:hypothetical protein n=1 Tax=Yinghuangia sp. YIM S09857 TaxID=3436929 RepID=UPI003F531186
MTGTVEDMADGTPALGAVARMRVMAAGVRGARVVEGVVPASFADVWLVMGDLEGGFGEFQPDMRKVRVERLDGDRVTALAHSRYGPRARLHGVLRPGWCWLQSRFLVVGMAAEPTGNQDHGTAGAVGGTRVALTGGVRVPGRAMLLPGAERELRRALALLTVRVVGPEGD